MQQIRIAKDRKVNVHRYRERLEMLPLDARDQAVVRAKELLRQQRSA